MGVVPGDRKIRVARALALALLLLLLADTVPAQVQPFEMGVAGREAGLLRGLAQRLSKQNLLYQLHLAGLRKEDMLQTSGEIDRILELLETGSPAYAIPAPWVPSINSQLRATDAAWGILRPIATASPYDYLRRTRQFMPPEDRRGDPLSIRYFDNLSNDLAGEATKLLASYESECLNTEFPLCRAARSSGLWAMLTQRIVKEAIFVFAGIEIEDSLKQLEADRTQLDQLLLGARELPLIQAAMAPERGKRGAFVAGLVDGIESEWRAFGVELDFILARDERALDVDRLLRIERGIVGQMQRLNTTITRYAIARFGG